MCWDLRKWRLPLCPPSLSSHLSHQSARWIKVYVCCFCCCCCCRCLLFAVCLGLLQLYTLYTACGCACYSDMSLLRVSTHITSSHYDIYFTWPSLSGVVKIQKQNGKRGRYENTDLATFEKQTDQTERRSEWKWWINGEGWTIKQQHDKNDLVIKQLYIPCCVASTIKICLVQIRSNS